MTIIIEQALDEFYPRPAPTILVGNVTSPNSMNNVIDYSVFNKEIDEELGEWIKYLFINLGK